MELQREQWKSKLGIILAVFTYCIFRTLCGPKKQD